MRVVGALLLTLSSITPASSVFVIVPGVFHEAGTGAFLSMAATAFVSLAVAFVYAELASAFPIAGGEYSMVGKTLGPAAGFVVLALTAVGNMLAPAVLSLGAADYLAWLLPGIDATAIAVAFIVLTTALGILHVRTNAWITGIFLFIELAALAVLAVLGFSEVHRPVSELFLHPVMLSQGSLVQTPLMIIGLSTAVSVFAYNGYGAAVYFSEEMHEAPRLVARTIIWALVVTVITEFVPVLAVLLGAPDVTTLLKSESPFGEFVLQAGGHALSIALSLGIALAIFNAVLATVMMNGRFFYSTGRDGTWHPHINFAFAQTHSRFNSPWVATLASGGSAILMCFIGMDLLLELTGMGLVLTYLVLCVGVLVGRRTGSTGHAAYRMPFFPWIPLLGVLALVFIIVASWTGGADSRNSLILNGVLVVASLVYYRFVLRRSGEWALTGPDDGVSR
jgi:amino acid transporter